MLGWADYRGADIDNRRGSKTSATRIFLKDYLINETVILFDLNSDEQDYSLIVYYSVNMVSGYYKHSYTNIQT